MKRFLLVNNHLLTGNTSPGLTPFSISNFFKFLFTSIAFFAGINCNAQQTSEEQKQIDYKKAITERSAKIVKTIELNDAAKYEKLLNIISNQYFTLNTIHEQFKAAVTNIKSQLLEKTTTEEAIKKEEEKKTELLKQRHSAFIAHLKEELTDIQIEKVKDGMTYSVLQVTYKAYQGMLLNLTTEQKEKIQIWLKEARELAMMEGSSEDKHKVFGKYKGKINNYLSAAGYDMKKEEKDWLKRIKEKRDGINQSS